MTRLLQEYEYLVIALNGRAAYAGKHACRVQALAGELGRRCGLDLAELKTLHAACKYHDIGKIGVPEAILLKPGALDAEEWCQAQTHAEFGQRICTAMPYEEMHGIGAIVRHHHEHYDGSGYPDRLHGEAIPLLARILALADSYDSIATARPYHGARNHEQTMALMADEDGHKFDPYLFGKFAPLIAHSDFRARAA